MKKILFVLLVVMLCTSCDTTEINDIDDETLSLITSFLANENIEDLELVYENDEVDVYHFTDSDIICDAGQEYLYKDIAFQTNGCDDNFLSFGYIAMYRDEIYELESLIGLHLINEVEISSFVEVLQKDDDLSLLEDIPFPSQNEIEFLFIYDDLSVYSNSVEKLVVPFLLDDTVNGYVRYNPNHDYHKSLFIPVLEVYLSGEKVYRYIGAEIIKFIDDYSTCKLSQTEVECLSIIPNTNYIERYGNISGYDIVRANIGVAQYISTEYTYKGYIIYSGTTYGNYGNKIASTGVWAMQNDELIHIEELIESGLIDIEEVVRLIPYFS